jgi:integrase
MDTLVERHSKQMADAALKTLSAICHWVETRDDTFRSPIVRGMRRSSPVPRARILDDGEIKTIWTLAGESGSFGAFVQLALLLGQRRSALSSMRWDQIDDTGTWHIPRLPREKQNGGSLRSLLSRCGAAADASELVLGHVLPGGVVRKTYDRYTYLKEKRESLLALSTLIERIVNPSDNVIALEAVS